MLQSLILAFYIAVNAPDFHITSFQVMQEKETVMAASTGQESDEESTYPEYEQIPLSNELKKYIYDESVKYRVSYELILSIAYVESKFDIDALSYDGSSTGLFQLNRRNTVNWICEQMGVKRLNPNNPYEATRMAVWYVDYLRKKYLAEGYDEEALTKRVLLAYRFGMSKSKRKSINHPYVKAVLNYKYQLESGEISVNHP